MFLVGYRTDTFWHFCVALLFTKVYDGFVMSIELVSNIGTRVLQELERRDWTPGDLAYYTRRAGRKVPEHKVRRWVEGRKVWVEDAVTVADTLEISLDELLRGPEWRAPDLPGIAAQQDSQLVGSTA